MTQEISLSIEISLNSLIAYCQKKPIQRLGLFGSVLRDDFAETSDVDVLVEYLPSAQITLLDMANQEMELSHLLGYKVDLRTAKELSPYFREDVLAKTHWLYERN